MDSITELLITQWFGIVSLIVAFFVSLFFYKRSIREARLIYKIKTINLIGGEYRRLPEDIEVKINGKSVEGLSQTKIAVWNYGNKTLKGEEMYEKNPFRFTFKEDIHFLLTPILICNTSDGDVNIQYEDNELYIGFEFLKPNKGFSITQ